MTKILRSAGTGSTRTFQVDTGKDVVSFGVVSDGNYRGIDVGRDAVRELVDHLDCWLRARAAGGLPRATGDSPASFKLIPSLPVGTPNVMALEPWLTGHGRRRRYSVQSYDDGSVILTPVVEVFMTEVERAAWEQWRNAQPALAL